MNRIITILASTLLYATTHAQPCGMHDNGVLNAATIQQNVLTKKVIAYPSIREADYIWSKRVWRTIDLRQKFNYPLYYPLEKMDCRWSLFDILRTHIEEGTLTAYLTYDYDDLQSPEDGDQFKYPLTPGRWGKNYTVYKKRLLNEMDVLDPIDVIVGYDPEFGTPIYDYNEDGSVKQRVDTNYYPILSKDIVQYKVKEDWFFDKQRSVLDVRILGVAPVMYDKSESGAITGYRTLFWIYFPEARYILQNYYTYNSRNDARRMSFDDLFWKRKFHSVVTKESNVYDRGVNEYALGVEALLESDKIESGINTFEQDLWHY